ncbi:M20 family metallo-hydrolase [Pseudochryseolinea flava]|uniref:Acetylornithine deacetylase n=1 Tax=Pseudochryseolinea flava TaxID=2059302 RepID=A0A364Y5S6_9BACT|nr:M20 family metallo-hydrolase [Pseudochryseolinea flava]RAW01711.1 acetylornithine deacetylase [Pseudochryseolinea flava]
MELHEKATDLLLKLIAIPSFSKEEDEVASVLEEFFEKQQVHSYRKGNNVWVKNKYFDPAKPTVLLNSHHDTVKPNPQYTRDPFKPEIIDGKLYGLGSNDAGGPLVSLIATFLHYYPQQNLKYNVVMAATAEEEISGTGGIESIWTSLPTIDFAIVGEPTLCQMATAEKGLMVIDCIARGKAGHAAREEGINAIYEALADIEWFRTHKFPLVSDTLGPIKMTVTIINAGKQHNVVPAECHYTVDVRVTDKYTLEELLETIKKNVKSEVTPRSLRMRPSGIDDNHDLVKAAVKLGIHRYGSPTTSDQALIPTPSIKMGPGDSARSHSADEFIFAHEIKQGIDTYIKVLNEVIL